MELTLRIHKLQHPRTRLKRIQFLLVDNVNPITKIRGIDPNKWANYWLSDSGISWLLIMNSIRSRIGSFGDSNWRNVADLL